MKYIVFSFLVTHTFFAVSVVTLNQASSLFVNATQIKIIDGKTTYLVDRKKANLSLKPFCKINLLLPTKSIIKKELASKRLQGLSCKSSKKENKNTAR